MINAQDLVKAHLYTTEEDVIRDAMRFLLRGRPDLRIQLALQRYEREEISLAKAASLAGVSWAQMREIVLEYGIEPALGPATLKEAEIEVQNLREFFTAHP